ncbi:MAG: hypothetical protein WC603_02110 [Candidatus Paceibacterota bacterium]
MRIFNYFILILILPLLIWPSPIYAFDTGVVNPGTMADDAAVGTASWTFPDGAKTSNNSHAYASSTSTETTHYLKATNFGFSIPTGATINGILVEIERYYETLGAGTVKDSEVKIIKSDGTIGTTDKADTINVWPLSDTYKSYGSSSDLWGETWAYSDINDADFGVVLSASLLDDFPFAYVDHIRITVYYSTGFSCSVTTAVGCSGTVILRMSGSTNAHPELPSESNANYASNVVCCTGIVGLGNSCSGNYAIVGKLSSATNGHFQENTYGTYGNNFCLSSTTPGDEITIGYQNTNCSGYDTTLFSTSSSDNGTVGDGNAYTRKICGTVTPLYISFSISDNSIYFGNLRSSGACWAQGTDPGAVVCPSQTETEAFNMTASTNATSGYSITVQGPTLTLDGGGDTITPLGSNTFSNPGTEQFGIRFTATGGAGTVTVPYAASGYAYVADANTSDEVASSVGDSATTTYSARYIANISNVTEAGTYSANHTYILTGTF